MNIAHRVEQGSHLLLPGANHGGIRVARRRDAERRRQIEILLSFRVPDVNAFRALPNDGPRAVRFGTARCAIRTRTLRLVVMFN
jgi:hypothetical protein